MSRTPRKLLPALLVVLLIAGGIGAGYAYLYREWRRATAAFDRGQAAESRTHLDRCEWLWKNDYDYRLLAAKAARLSGDLPAAEEHLTRCRQIRGEATTAVQIEHLLVRVQRGDGEEAAAPLFALVEKDHPQTAYILYTMSGVYYAQMRFQFALASLNKWAEVDPANPAIYPLRGLVLERLDNPKAAFADYEKAVELNPDVFEPRLRMAEMLIEDKKTPDAVGHLERLSITHPHRPEVRARLGMCRYYEGKKDEARRLMEGAIDLMPTDPALLVGLARLDIQDQDGAAAEKRLRAVIASDPAEEEGRFLLVSALRLQKRHADADEAQKDHDRVKGLNDKLTKMLRDTADKATAGPDEWGEIGSVLLQLGLDRRAFVWFDRVFKHDPNHQPTHRVLTAYYEKKGDAKNAADHRSRLR